MPTPDADARRAPLANYDFRALHPRLAFGTASDRYAGWVGQIYPVDPWATRIKSRAKKLGGETFEEQQVPIASAGEYFRHFSVLELDFTFYRPLLEDDGAPSSNYFVLQNYAAATPEEARFILKAPQAYSARILRRGSGYAANPTYLDASGYHERFAKPARDILGERLRGVIFEQEYGRVADSPDPAAFADELEQFFSGAPAAPQVHLEVRSSHLLEAPYFEMLRRRGLGFCFSHWTYLPSIREQWERAGGPAGEAFSAEDGQVVVRLLTPRNMRYADAYATAHPFDRPVPELCETPQAREMVDDTTALIFRAIEDSRTINVIVNNRAWGNAPSLARAVATRFLDFAPERGA